MLQEAMLALSCLDAEGLEGLEGRLRELATDRDAGDLAVSLGLRRQADLFEACVESTGKNLKVLRRLFDRTPDRGVAA